MVADLLWSMIITCSASRMFRMTADSRTTARNSWPGASIASFTTRHAGAWQFLNTHFELVDLGPIDVKGVQPLSASRALVQLLNHLIDHKHCLPLTAPLLSSQPMTPARPGNIRRLMQSRMPRTSTYRDKSNCGFFLKRKQKPS